MTDFIEVIAKLWFGATLFFWIVYIRRYLYNLLSTTKIAFNKCRSTPSEVHQAKDETEAAVRVFESNLGVSRKAAERVVIATHILGFLFKLPICFIMWPLYMKDEYSRWKI
ncbi:MAG: hypothetical protein ACRC8W_09360 [Plesiomonas shigelloides]